MAKTVNQAISLDGSDLYEVKGTNVYSGQVTMYDSLSGIGGQPFVPYDGATVYVASNELDALDTVRKFELSLNNKAYYLVSNVRFTEDQTQQLFDSATEITMTYDGGLNRYVGSFVYNNPDNYPYLYLVWNYTDNAFDGTAYYVGEESNGKEIYFYRGSNGSTSYSTECSTESTNFSAKYVGSGPLPVLGDRIYDASFGTPFNGNNKYYVISDTYQTSPSSSNTYAKIDEDGIVQEIGTCGCSEVDPPEIIQDDLELIIGQPVNVQINATNNPTSWAIISDYKRYSVTGGTKGSIWTITNLDATTTNVVVNIQETAYVSSNIDPTLAFGDGVYSEVAVNQSDLLPKGVSFDTNTGLLSGTPVSTSDYSIVLTATNCVGTSTEETVNVIVTTGIQLTPFAVDVENFEDTDTAACAISPIYSLLYHNGTASLPDVKDIIYIDYRARDPFMGGSRWYNMDNSTYAIQIDELGNVIGRASCPIP